MIAVSRIQSPVLITTHGVNRPFREEDFTNVNIDPRTLQISTNAFTSTNCVTGKTRFDSYEDLKQKDVVVMVCLSGGGARAARMAAHALANLEWRYNVTVSPESAPLSGLIDGWSGVSGGSVYASFVATRLKQDKEARADTFEVIANGYRGILGTKQLGGVAAVSYMWGYAPAMQLTTEWDTLHLFAHNLALLQNQNPFIFPSTRECKLGDLPQKPRFYFNATCRETGRPFIFTQSVIHRDLSGDALSRLNQHVDPLFGWITNSQSISLTPDQAEPLKFASTVEDLGGPPNRIPLAFAVMASAAFPGVFEPLTLHHYFYRTNNTKVTVAKRWAPWKQNKVTVADGGLYDNTGLVTALQMFDYLRASPGCEKKKLVILSIDANNHSTEYQKPGGAYALPFRLDSPIRGMIPALETAGKIYQNQQELVQAVIQLRIRALQSQKVLQYYSVRLKDLSEIKGSHLSALKKALENKGDIEDLAADQILRFDPLGLVKDIPTDFVMKAGEDRNLKVVVEQLLNRVPSGEKQNIGDAFIQAVRESQKTVNSEKLTLQ